MRFIRIITLIILLATTFYMPVALADSNGQVFGACPGAGDNSPIASSPVCQDKNTTQDPVIHVINVAANIIALLAGVAAIILIIVSGLTMITSGGNQEAVANSRKHITAAIIGLVIIVLAWTITRFVTDKIIQ